MIRIDIEDLIYLLTRILIDINNDYDQRNIFLWTYIDIPPLHGRLSHNIDENHIFLHPKSFKSGASTFA